MPSRLQTHTHPGQRSLLEDNSRASWILTSCTVRLCHSIMQASGGGVDVYSPVQRINSMPTQFFRVSFGGPTQEEDPIQLFSITNTKQ